jgi:hypothetical protein
MVIRLPATTVRGSSALSVNVLRAIVSESFSANIALIDEGSLRSIRTRLRPPVIRRKFSVVSSGKPGTPGIL